MKNYAIAIAKKVDLELIEANLKTEFKSYDYMLGFLDGYLFDSYKIIVMDDLEKYINKKGHYNTLEKYYIKFVYINGKTE